MDLPLVKKLDQLQYTHMDRGIVIVKLDFFHYIRFVI